MSTDTQAANKRIAKNTVFLYIRTAFVMLVSLYTSRVVLKALGVEDFGVYSAVGGFVAMFSVVSSALSSAISRFITYEIGTGDTQKLRNVFCTSVNIEIVISVIVVLLVETIGVWFLNNKMSIPDGRMQAANWIMQLSTISFVVGLLSVPYNACIIAHEHLNIYAYMGIFDALCRLAGAFLISVSPFDRLIFYGILLTAVSLIFRIVYGVYCRIHFAESKYAFMFDKSLFREMFGFAGWSFLTNTAWIFNTQGVSMLVNVYFGVVVNAARSVAAQVEGAVMQFVNNFTVAFNPQITKSYASDDKERMFYLINKGSRFSFFLFLFFAIPVYFEADFILSLWLKVVPENAVSFVRLSLIALIPNLIGNTGYVACMATGNIRKYTVLLTTIACTSFFITWIAFYSGLAPQSTYVIFAVVYAFVEVARLIMMKQLLNFQIMTFVKDVIAKCTIVLALACIVPFFVTHCLEQSWYRLIITVISGFLSSAAIMYFIGMSYGERNTLKTALVSRIRSHKFQNHF